MKNQLNQTTLSAPKLNRKLSQFPHKEAQSVTQQSEVWSPSSDMESGWACFVLLKGRLSVLGKAAHSPCWSSTFTPHFAELQSGLPYVGHSFPWPNNQAEQSEVQWRTQPRPWPLNLITMENLPFSQIRVKCFPFSDLVRASFFIFRLNLGALNLVWLSWFFH